MVFENKDEDWRKIILECDCGCSSIELYQDQDEWKTVYLSFKVDAFSAEQRPVIEHIKEWFKMAWMLLRGKSYRFFDIVLTQKSVADLKEAIATLEIPEERK